TARAAAPSVDWRNRWQPHRSTRRTAPGRSRRQPAGSDAERRRRRRSAAVTKPTGVAGRLAAAFIHSKLTPLVILASLLLGVYAILALPREEEPQIIVPMIDVFVAMPGASPSEVEQRVTRPLERRLWE